MSRALLVLLLAAARRRARRRERRDEPVARAPPLNIAHQGGEDEFPSNTHVRLQAGAQGRRRHARARRRRDQGRPDRRHARHDGRPHDERHGHDRVAHAAQIRQLDGAYWFARRRRRLPPRPQGAPPTAGAASRPASAGRPRATRPPTSASPRCARSCARSRTRRSTSRSRAARRPRRVAEYLTQRRGAGRAAEARPSAGPDRRLLQAGRGQPLPRAGAEDRGRAGHRRHAPTGCSAASRPAPASSPSSCRSPTSSAARRSTSRTPTTSPSAHQRRLRVAHLAERRRRVAQRPGRS